MEFPSTSLNLLLFFVTSEVQNQLNLSQHLKVSRVFRRSFLLWSFSEEAAIVVVYHSWAIEGEPQDSVGSCFSIKSTWFFLCSTWKDISVLLMSYCHTCIYLEAIWSINIWLYSNKPFPWSYHPNLYLRQMWPGLHQILSAPNANNFPFHILLWKCISLCSNRMMSGIQSYPLEYVLAEQHDNFVSQTSFPCGIVLGCSGGSQNAHILQKEIKITV